MRAALAIALLAAACGGHAPAAAPQTPVENTQTPAEDPPAPAASAEDCARVAPIVARMLVLEDAQTEPLTPDDVESDTEGLRGPLEQSCDDNGWSVDVVACFDAMQGPSEIEGCYQQMTDAQADAFNATVDNN